MLQIQSHGELGLTLALSNHPIHINLGPLSNLIVNIVIAISINFFHFSLFILYFGFIKVLGKLVLLRCACFIYNIVLLYTHPQYTDPKQYSSPHSFFKLVGEQSLSE